MAVEHVFADEAAVLFVLFYSRIVLVDDYAVFVAYCYRAVKLFCPIWYHFQLFLIVLVYKFSDLSSKTGLSQKKFSWAVEGYSFDCCYICGMKKMVTLALTLIMVLTWASWELGAQYRYNGHRCINVDDYSQYVPFAAGLGLGLVGVESKHCFTDRLLVSATSAVAVGVMVRGLKMVVDEERPDGSNFDSFPSGHTATAFVGAEIVRTEYGLGYGIAAYTIAAGTGFLRVYNGRHHVVDVLAGAGIGVLGARIGYWLLEPEKKLISKMFKKRDSDLSMSMLPFVSSLDGSAGVAFALVF